MLAPSKTRRVHIQSVHSKRYNPEPAADRALLETASRALRDQIPAFKTLDYAGPEAHEVAQYFWDYFNTEPEVLVGASATDTSRACCG